MATKKDPVKARFSELAASRLGAAGRMLSGSKGQYRWDNKDHLVVFNSNVCTAAGKIWHGDLDVTLDGGKLTALAKLVGEKIFVLYEFDARFENEQSPKVENAVMVVSPAGKMTIGKSLADYVEWRDGRVYLINRSQEDSGGDESEQETTNGWDELGDGVKEVDVPDVLELPIDSIKTTLKDSPIMIFWQRVQRGVGLAKGDRLRVGSFWVHGDDYDALKSRTREWLKQKYPTLTEYRVESELGWLMLDIGPNRFSSRHPPTFCRRGEVRYNAFSAREPKVG